MYAKKYLAPFENELFYLNDENDKLKQISINVKLIKLLLVTYGSFVLLITKSINTFCIIIVELKRIIGRLIE